MKGRVKNILSILMIFSFIISMISINSSYAKTNSNRKIVVFEENVDQVKKDKILEKHGVTKVKEIIGTNAVVVHVSSDDLLINEPDIRYIEDDMIISISGKVNDDDSTIKAKKIDEIRPEQPEEVIPWGVQYMEAPDIWAITKGDGVKVAIIDTGVDIDHPDLVDNIKGGYNTITKKGSYDDDNGHGTHIAGTIAASDNEIGVIGVAPEVDLYSIKSFDSNGEGYVSDIIEAIEWSIVNDIDIINMSFGFIMKSTALYESILDASNAGIVMVAAAGNNYGGYAEYPAAYPEVVSIGGIDEVGNPADFSARNGVDIWAPSTSIYSTYINDDYVEMDGTSMATAHWTGKFILQMRTNN